MKNSSEKDWLGRSKLGKTLNTRQMSCFKTDRQADYGFGWKELDVKRAIEI